MDIDHTKESVKLLKEELDIFINELFGEEFKNRTDIMMEKGEMSNEDCIFLKNVYSTYLSYIMFYIYFYAYDNIIAKPELFGDNINIKEILLSTMKFKFGYDSTKYNLYAIIEQIKYTYTECDQNENDFKSILRAKFPFYEENFESFFEIYTILIEFASLYKKIYKHDITKSKLFLKKILDINIYNNIKNLAYDITLIKNVCLFINNMYNNNLTGLLLNFDIIIENFDIILSYSVYDKDILNYMGYLAK